MPAICPTITAYTQEDYRKEVHKLAHLGHRLHIDLTDGKFAPVQTVKPDQAWWPAGFKADFHLMYEQPMHAVREIVQHKPNLVIIHAESEGNFNEVAAFCHDHEIRAGVALLPQTSVMMIEYSLVEIDHVLIFSGNLGHQGGSHADLSLLSKAKELRQLKPDLEIGWDGGVNDQNVAELVYGGIDVINAGGYIQSADDPELAFNALQRIADETGET